MHMNHKNLRKLSVGIFAGVVSLCFVSMGFSSFVFGQTASSESGSAGAGTEVDLTGVVYGDPDMSALPTYCQDGFICDGVVSNTVTFPITFKLQTSAKLAQSLGTQTSTGRYAFSLNVTATLEETIVGSCPSLLGASTTTLPSLKLPTNTSTTEENLSSSTPVNSFSTNQWTTNFKLTWANHSSVYTYTRTYTINYTMNVSSLLSSSSFYDAIYSPLSSGSISYSFQVRVNP